MKGLIKYIILAILVAILCLLVSRSFAAEATFSWLPNPPEDNVTHYDIHYGLASGTYTTHVDTGVPTLVGGRHVYTVTSIPEGDTMFFACTATNAEATSDYSTELSYDVPITPPPTIVESPQDFRITEVN